MIAIINYGVGNLFSLAGSLRHMGIDSLVTGDPAVLADAERIILPGVGAFGDAVDKFRESGLEAPLKAQVAAGKPLLGICVGMQILFETGYEFGEHKGLGFLHGSIHSLAGDIPANYKVPQIGWNSLHIARPNDPLLRYAKQGEYVYFVHSFYAKDCADSVVAWVEYGTQVPAIVRAGNVWGTQFHPEKSGRVGLGLLKAFSEVE